MGHDVVLSYSKRKLVKPCEHDSRRVPSRGRREIDTVATRNDDKEEGQPSIETFTK